MKNPTQIFAVVLITILFFSGNSLAQDNDQQILVVSQNMVSMSDVGKVNKLGDSIFVPVLKELVDEGYILSFGQFNHNWGDEWNVNYWYVAKDMSSFDTFWNEYVSRVSERHPGAFGSTVKYFQAHKDNIYTIRNQYPVPPKK